MSGFGVAYIDWSQQEIIIAAALSEDKAMQAAYHFKTLDSFWLVPTARKFGKPSQLSKFFDAGQRC